MKVSCKAVLLSAFVFPGVGHFYLKKYWKGLVVMLAVLGGVGFMVWSATAAALNRLDSVMVNMQGGGGANLQDISGIIGSKPLPTTPYYDAALYAVACCWILAVIDAYRIGKQRDLQDKEPSIS